MVAHSFFLALQRFYQCSKAGATDRDAVQQSACQTHAPRSGHTPTRPPATRSQAQQSTKEHDFEHPQQASYKTCPISPILTCQSPSQLDPYIAPIPVSLCSPGVTLSCRITSKLLSVASLLCFLAVSHALKLTESAQSHGVRPLRKTTCGQQL